MNTVQVCAVGHPHGPNECEFYELDVTPQCEHGSCADAARYTVRYFTSRNMPNGYVRTCRAHAGSALHDAPPHCSVTIDPDN